MMDKHGAWGKLEIRGKGPAAQYDPKYREPKNHEDKEDDLEGFLTHNQFIV